MRCMTVSVRVLCYLSTGFERLGRESACVKIKVHTSADVKKWVQCRCDGVR